MSANYWGISSFGYLILLLGYLVAELPKANVKDNNNFTFIINQIPTEKIWTLSSAKIERVGVYIGDLTSLYIDKYTIFRL